MSQRIHRDLIAVNVEGEGEGGDWVPTGQHLDIVPRTDLQKTAIGDRFGLSSFEMEPDPDIVGLLDRSITYAVLPV